MPQMQSRKEAFRRQTSKRLLSNAADVDQLMPESSLQEVAAAAAGNLCSVLSIFVLSDRYAYNGKQVTVCRLVFNLLVVKQVIAC